MLCVDWECTKVAQADLERHPPLTQCLTADPLSPQADRDFNLLVN